MLTAIATMEILLRHAVQWLGMLRSPAANTPGVLDNEQAFLDDLSQLSKSEQKAVFSTHLLCMCADGGVAAQEYELWAKMCDMVEDDVATNFPDRVGYLACRFRNYVPLSAEMIEQCFDSSANVPIPTGWGGFRYAFFYQPLALLARWD